MSDNEALRLFDPASIPCSCFSDVEEDMQCCCGDEERVLRHVAGTDGQMTTEQRSWCLGEINKVEGYDVGDYVHCSSADIARGVLNAWTDYCRDNGLL